MKFEFTNKEQYLAYRSNWKAQYKELSQQIRDYKFCLWFLSLRMGYGKSLNMNQFLVWEKNYKRITAKYGNKFYYVHSLKQKATAMLEELAEAKKEAQVQYLAAQAAKKELVTA